MKPSGGRSQDCHDSEREGDGMRIRMVVNKCVHLAPSCTPKFLVTAFCRIFYKHPFGYGPATGVGRPEIPCMELPAPTIPKLLPLVALPRRGLGTTEYIYAVARSELE